MTKVKKIQRDTDGEYIPNLPKEVDVPDNIDDEDVADWLSDNYGFCVYGFEFD